MADGVFQANFATAVAERGAPYIEARDKILALDAAVQVQVVLALKRVASTPSDWRTSLSAEILLGWLENRPLYLKCDQYVRGELPPPAPLPGFTVRHRIGATHELGPAVVPRVLERLWKTGEHGDATERATLFGVLRDFADRRAVMPMIELIGDASSSADVQGSAASVLGTLDAAPGLDPVLRLARDPGADATARGVAIRSLGRFSDPRATQALLDILKRAELPLEDRRGAAEGLRERADPTTRPAMLATLQKEQDKLLRVALIQTFGRVGTLADIPPLQDLAAKNPELQERIDGALKDIRRRGQARP